MSERPTGRSKPAATRRAFMIGGTTATISIALPPAVRAQSTTIVSTIFGGAFEAAYRAKDAKASAEPSRSARSIGVPL